MPDPIPPPRTDSVTGFSEEDGAQYFGHVEPRWEAAAPGSGATDSHGSTQTLPRPSPARRDSVESVGTDGLNFFEDDDLVDAYPPALDFSSYTDWDYTKWDYPKWDIKDIKDKIRHSWVSSEQFKKFLVILTAILVAQGAMKLLDPNCVRTCPPEEQVVPCAVEPGLATQYTSVHPSQEAPRSWAQNSLKYMQSPMKVISGTMGDVLVKSFQVAERRKPSPLLRGTFSTDPWASPPRKKSFPQKGGPYTYPEKEWEQVIENSESTDWYGAQLKNIAVANMTSTLKQEIAGQKLSTWFGTPTQAGKLKRALDGLNKDNTSILKKIDRYRDLTNRASDTLDIRNNLIGGERPEDLTLLRQALSGTGDDLIKHLDAALEKFAVVVNTSGSEIHVSPAFFWLRQWAIYARTMHGLVSGGVFGLESDL